MAYDKISSDIQEVIYNHRGLKILMRNRHYYPNAHVSIDKLMMRQIRWPSL